MEHTCQRHDPPVVSVIIPVYNAERYISRCLSSVVAQAFQDFEIIVVDDESSDRSPEMAASVLREADRLVHQQNTGCGGARNRGVAEAQGQYLAFLDADDYWHPDFLQAMLALFAKHPTAGLAFCRWHAGRRRVLPRGQTDGLFEDYFAVAASCGGYIGAASSSMMPRAVFDAVGGFDTRPAEDNDMWCRIALSYPVAYTERLLSYYSILTEDSLTSREVHSGRIPYPLAVTTAKQCMAEGRVCAERVDSLRAYCGALLDSYAALLLTVGKRQEARAVLREARSYAPLNPAYRGITWKLLLPAWSYRPARTVGHAMTLDLRTGKDQA